MSATPTTPELIALTDQNVIDLLDCAGYGITYWADSATVDEKAKTYSVTSEDLVEDGPSLARVVSFDQINTAFNQLASTGQLPEWQMREIKDDDLAFDAMVADMTVQLALFSEIVYG